LKIKQTLKNNIKVDLTSKSNKLLPLQISESPDADKNSKNKDFTWRKFNSGIASYK
jgi:hypothetical protein